ncbi:bifunctional diguanylate cyclase/phosphodiesterase [Conexibacter sp. CPCC 206217]|uniref:putative bifunctional diguanylate cyclase/phosphodiesterase n=1 Tax=Conexibacter sp. CPCC 206217 TaxID=3064574 RepID=UPI00271A699F|nr:EAL domain-containing protein [Conexibacter sp. CPCC 206217]MDO8209923.1 EAL domain-containing protein [Conexibacter sp. CPCC 206217]
MRQQTLTNRPGLELIDLGRAQHLLSAHYEVHELMLREAPLQDVLAELARGMERHSDGMLASLLLLDQERRTLHTGAAPSLPLAYVDALDGIAIGPAVGSCGSAAYHASEVIVVDIQADARWSEHRELAAEHDLGACWSVPILDAGDAVLGTFALYYRAPRAPQESELRLIRHASRLAAIAIERHRAHAKLQRLATRDILTGLPNRALLLDRLAQALARAQRTGTAVAVVFVDLDRFKLVNDSLGHEMGDWMLREVADRLSAAVSPGATVARFGGDEFVVVAEGVAAVDAHCLPTQLHAALEAPLLHPLTGEHTVSAHLGIALTDASTDPREALRRAESALYEAKRDGVTTRLYSDELRRRATEQLQLHSALRRALPRGELELAYQPIIAADSGRVVAFESLMRWDNPRLGRVSPAHFIPAAEESGLILELGDWALARATAQASAWAAEYGPVAMAVNISARQLIDPELPARIERTLGSSGLDPSLLVLEVTETALLEHDVRAVRSLATLSRLGVHIALDDFGTGYSSFARLRTMPIDAVKIDKTFVDDLGHDADARAIVTAMIGVAQGLDLAVTAEGVETQEQLELLRELGCSHLQGYLLGRPQPAAEATAVLAAGGVWARG